VELVDDDIYLTDNAYLMQNNECNRSFLTMRITWRQRCSVSNWAY